MLFVFVVALQVKQFAHGAGKGQVAVQNLSPAGLALFTMPKGVKIFVGGLPDYCTENELKVHFSRYGPVVACELQRDPQGNSRRFGYLAFQVSYFFS